jgi:hypothetical protein
MTNRNIHEVLFRGREPAVRMVLEHRTDAMSRFAVFLRLPRQLTTALPYHATAHANGMAHWRQHYTIRRGPNSWLAACCFTRNATYYRTNSVDRVGEAFARAGFIVIVPADVLDRIASGLTWLLLRLS